MASPTLGRVRHGDLNLKRLARNELAGIGRGASLLFYGSSGSLFPRIAALCRLPSCDPCHISICAIYPRATRYNMQNEMNVSERTNSALKIITIPRPHLTHRRLFLTAVMAMSLGMAGSLGMAVSALLSFAERSKGPEGLVAAIEPRPRTHMSLAAEASAAEIQLAFESVEIDLNRLRTGNVAIPRIFVEQMPRDLAAMKVIQERKAVFVKSVLPHILDANERVLEDRILLERMKAHINRGGTLNARDLDWLDDIADLYGGTTTDLADLLKRVDIVPPSLALAQAALESGWGTSRFAQKANALFGQYTYIPSKGMAPKGTEDDPPYLIRIFPDIGQSVRSYVHNLNSHRAYSHFREKRAAQRDGTASHSSAAIAIAMNSEELTRTLTRYSERGKAYIADVVTILNSNSFRDFDAVDLAPATVAMR